MKENKKESTGKKAFMGSFKVWTTVRGGFSQVRGPVGSPSSGDIYYDEAGASRQMMGTKRDRQDPVIELPPESIKLPPTWSTSGIKKAS